jgi:hypothetical protein
MIGDRESFLEFEKLYISGNKVSGRGKDDVGLYDISGTCVGEAIKFYKTYMDGNSVMYEGKYDGQGIDGKWHLNS